MGKVLDLNIVPEYCYSSYRKFVEGEKHVTRYCKEDVLLVMLEGKLLFHEDQQAIELTQGEYYIQRKGLYQQGIEKNNTCYYYYVHFHGGWADMDGIPVRGTYPEEVVRLIEKLDFLNAGGGSMTEKAMMFLRIISTLKRDEHSNPKTFLAQKVERLLRANIKNGISLDELALTLNYSKNYIIQSFKEVYRKTPHEYLNHLRLEEAELRLKYSDMTLMEIAEECGYGCYPNFYKAYKKAYGKSPRMD